MKTTPRTRRDFLCHSLAGLVAGCTLGGTNPVLAMASQAKSPYVDFPTEPRARLAISSWSFRDYIKTPRDGNKSKQAPGMSLPEFAAWVKREFNVPGV
jgi:hypothetical protein